MSVGGNPVVTSLPEEKVSVAGPGPINVKLRLQSSPLTKGNGGEFDDHARLTVCVDEL